MRFKGIFTMIVFLCLVFTLTGLALAQSTDVPGHWAEQQISDLQDQGIVTGYPDGTFKPDNKITRAEFFTLVNKAFGFTDKAAIPFSDVAANDWFAGEIAKAVAVGYISGYPEGTVKPNNYISRQEVAAIVAKLLRLDTTGANQSLDRFQDINDIPGWGKATINAVVTEGYMGGYPDETFKATRETTRAEGVVLLNNIAGVFVNFAGTNGPDSGARVINGHLTINTSGVKLQNTIIVGNLYITEGVGDGEVELYNVTVKGKTLIAGGGSNSIIIKNSTLGKTKVDRPTGSVRVVATGSSRVEEVAVSSGARLESTEATGVGFKNVIIEQTIPDNAQVQLAGKFEDVKVAGASAKVEVTSGSIAKLEVANGATGATVNVQAQVVVTRLEINVAANITGTGTIETAVVKAQGSTIAQTPGSVEVAQGITVVVANQQVTSATIPAPAPAPISGGGGGGDDSGPGSGPVGGDQTAPTFNAAEVWVFNDENKIIIIPFNETIVLNAGDLKGNIRIARDGTTFVALHPDDNVLIGTAGEGYDHTNRLILTLDSPIEGSQTRIKILANTLKDAAGNVQANELVTGSITALAADNSDPDVELTNLEISDAPANFTFAPGTYTYTGVTVANNVTSVTVTPTLADATIMVNETPVATGQASQAITLVAGVETTITVNVVKAGTTAKDYVINITRLPIWSHGATIGDITLEPTADSITYGPNDGIYIIDGNLTVAGAEAGTVTLRNLRVTGDLTINTPNATVNVENSVEVDGNTEIVAVSPNTFNSTANHHSGIEVKGAATLNLTGSAGQAPVKVSTSANIRLAGTIGLVQVAAPNAQLTVGGNVDSLLVEQDGATINNDGGTLTSLLRTSSVDGGSITRGNGIPVPQQVADKLTGLTVDTGTLTPVFNGSTYKYNVVVSNGVEAITVTPTLAEGTTRVVNLGVVEKAGGVVDGLQIGTNTITVVVSQEDSVDLTYTITVTRQQPPQATPTFNPAAGAVAFGTPLQIISAGADYIYYTTDGTDPVVGVIGATKLYNDSARPTIDGAVTVKAIAIKTGVPNSTIGEASYTQAASTDLADLVLSGTPGNFAFAADTYEYNGVTVANQVAEITVTPTGTGTITVDGTQVASGDASDAIALEAGVEKTITVVTTEAGKAAKSYTIKVTRGLSHDATVATVDDHYTVDNEANIIVSNQTPITPDVTVETFLGYLSKHVSASWKVVAAGTVVGTPAEFDDAAARANEANLAVGDLLAVKAQDGTIKVYSITVESEVTTLTVTSSGFLNNQAIPVKYANVGVVGGENASIPLQWDAGPMGTHSYVVLMYDTHTNPPGAEDFVHWALLDIPNDITNLEEGATRASKPNGSKELTNDFGQPGYGGPQAPANSGTHPYKIKVYALTSTVDALIAGPIYSRLDIEAAFAGSILAVGEITGTFTTQSISGTVSVNAGIPDLTEATVQLKQEETNVGMPISPAEDGTYTFPRVAIGTGYTLEVNLAGYEAETSDSFNVILGENMTQNFQLEKTDESRFTAALAQTGDKLTGVAFDLNITGAKGANGTNLTGEINVTVTSDTDGEIHNANAEFTDGVATVSVTLDAFGEHTLTVDVAGVTADETVMVNAIYGMTIESSNAYSVIVTISEQAFANPQTPELSPPTVDVDGVTYNIGVWTADDISDINNGDNSMLQITSMSLEGGNLVINVNTTGAEGNYKVGLYTGTLTQGAVKTGESGAITTLADSEGVFAFGGNGYGQLGLPVGAATTPTKIEGLSGIKAISAGENHTLVLTENGEVYSFGRGDYGALGHGDESSKNTPTKIESLAGVVAIAAGGGTYGGGHSLVLLENGDVYSFGRNHYGQLGHNDTDNRLIPNKIELEGLPAVKAIAAGQHHSLLLTEAGDVYSFGWNLFGQLGQSDTDNKLVPTKIDGLTGVKAISAGGAHSLVLLENGDVYSFGHGDPGRLGHGDYENKLSPTKINSLSQVKAVAAGGVHSLVLLENGEVFAFGRGTDGQLGYGELDDSGNNYLNHRHTPTQVLLANTEVRAIAAGLYHSLVLLENGDVYSFGEGSLGRLGHGDTGDRVTPNKIAGLSGVTAIAAGGEHSLVLVD